MEGSSQPHASAPLFEENPLVTPWIRAWVRTAVSLGVVKKKEIFMPLAEFETLYISRRLVTVLTEPY
jgi:hypothetical protein